mgnify:CR=1 FL=1
MKTLTFKYLKLFLLAVAMINLTSCEIEIDDFYDDDNIGGSYYNKSLDLCSRPWADTFYDADGNYCYQELNLSRSPWRRLYPGGISQRTLFRIGVLLYLELGGPFAILPSDGIWSR